MSGGMQNFGAERTLLESAGEKIFKWRERDLIFFGHVSVCEVLNFCPGLGTKPRKTGPHS